jgi:hypothetical protein
MNKNTMNFTGVAAVSVEVLPDENGAQEQSQLPEHLIRLPGGPWALWRWVALRGPGFSAAQVLKLASPECAAAADQLLQVEEEASRAKDAALESVNTLLDALRSTSGWEDDEKRAPLLKAMRQLKSGKLAAQTGVDAEADAAIEASRAAAAQLATALQIFQQTHKAATSDTSRKLREIASTGPFQEAIVWQNRHAYHSAIQRLLGKTPENNKRDSKQRQREELIASYLQRYCVKNDTIGFFGPVGWARIVPDGEALTVRPGNSFLAARNVYLEGWCIDALAENMTRNKELLPWAMPLRVPFIDVTGTTLHLPAQPPKEISRLQATVLQACDGEHTAKEIAADLLKVFPNEMKTESFVYKLLEALRAMGLIRWTFEVPLGPFPERALRTMIDRIEDDALRAPSLEAINKLEDARRNIARAAGEPEKLDEAFGQLEETFTSLTGVASTRIGGQTYAARTLVYEDCRRDGEVDIGQDILESLGPPLSLMLASARWFTFQIAAVYRKAFHEIFEEIVSTSGSKTVDCATFWLRSQRVFFGTHDIPVDALRPRLQQLWTDVLKIAPGERRVEYTSEELRPLVMEAFDVPDSGLKAARYHSPDIMIAASSAEAIRRGDYQLVMGELHLGLNTLGNSIFVEQHPVPEELYRAVEIDLPDPRFVAVIPKSWPTLTSRTVPVLFSEKDHRLILAADSCGVPKAQALIMGTLIIDNSSGELVARSRDGKQQFDLLDVYGEMLATLGVSFFRILPARGHTPRVTIDRLIVSRESWSFAPAEIEFAYEKDEATRMRLARRWARANDLPRFVFVKVPVEDKPFYVDFDSLIYLNMFAKTIRRTLESGKPDPVVTVTEMIPRTDETWLPDAEGETYTCEFRLVARHEEELH